MMPGQCRGEPDESSGSPPQGINQPTAGSQPISSSPPVAPTEDVTEIHYGAGFALTRITPEQLSDNLIRTTNYGLEYRYEDTNAGQTLDYLQMLFGVPLGGIDFISSARRDPSTKAQTLLVSRVVAWQFAAVSIWKEWDKPSSDRVVFTACDMGSDRPFQASDVDSPESVQKDILTGEKRWEAQVSELFWRAYSRPPTSDDMAAIKTGFLAAFNAEGYPQAGWIVVMYAILASQEFWHL